MRQQAHSLQPPGSRGSSVDPGIRDEPRQPHGWQPSACWSWRRHRFAKRGLDLALATIVLLLLAPLLFAVALLVRLSSPGPIIFRQTRIGRLGRPFVCYKFRSMYAGSDTTLHQDYYHRLVTESAAAEDGGFKLAHDPRVTRVGRLLRRLSLDELPQLANVLKGDMSIVGPRPPLQYEVDLYDARARCRLNATPGLTGLWQVSGRNRLNFQQMIDLDLEYIRRWSFWLDLRIVICTPRAVCSTRGAR